MQHAMQVHSQCHQRTNAPRSGNPSRLSALIEALRRLADGQPVSDIPFEGRSKKPQYSQNTVMRGRCRPRQPFLTNAQFPLVSSSSNPPRPVTIAATLSYSGHTTPSTNKKISNKARLARATTVTVQVGSREYGHHRGASAR